MRVHRAERCAEIRCEHAEGPTWDAQRGELLWVDILRGCVHRARPVAGGAQLELVATHPVGQCVGAVVPFADARLGWALASERGFARLGSDGALHVLAEPETRRGTRMNDGKCDPSGRLWAGSMAHDVTPGAGRLYRVGLDGDVQIVLPSVTVSNGLAWTPDGATMYYVDTPTRCVQRFDLDPATGAVLRAGTAFEVDDPDGSPDGMTIDDEGCLWIALWGASAVVCYTPDGRVRARVEVDAVQVSSCAFGGTAGRTLYITTSQEGLDDAERRRQPRAGYVFGADVGVTGPPASPCRVAIDHMSARAGLTRARAESIIR